MLLPTVPRLEFCDLSADQVTVLQETLKLQPYVTFLSLRGNPKCRDKLYLLVNVGLKILNVKMCEIDQYGRYTLAVSYLFYRLCFKFPALKKISEVFLDSSPDTGLLHLDLSSNKLFDEGCEYIASILRCDRGLVSLSIADCKITDTGLKEILETFRRFELRDGEILLRRKLRLEYYRMLYQVQCGLFR